MPEKLKPCPFCGGRGEAVVCLSRRNWHFIVCLKCGCRTAQYPKSLDIPFEAWNRRVNDNAYD